MGLDISVVISTFGKDPKFPQLARERAIPSAQSFGVPVLYNHGTSLHGTRNLGLSQVETEHVVFLDSDDELAPGFFEHISQVTGDLRPPSINYVHENRTFMPKVAGHRHDCVGECLRFGNWMIVGTVARTELLREVGGWKDWETWEDWDLWMRCWLAGATITPAPAAVYRAYSTPEGRCRNLPQEVQTRVYHAIRSANLSPLYDK